MFDLHYFDTLRTHGQTGIYFTFYAFAVAVLAYAAWWDRRQHRVPNWIWLFAMIPVPASLYMRDLTYDAIFLPVLFVVCLALRFKMSWGTGDAKAIVWLGLLLGSMPAIFITILATALVGTLPKQKMKGYPFVNALFGASLIGILLVIGWIR